LDNPSRDLVTIFRRKTLAYSSVTISGSSCQIGLGSKMNSTGSFHGPWLCLTNIVESRMGTFRDTSVERCWRIAVLRERQVCSSVDAWVQRMFNLWVRSSERS
jgi:hypothetical protein